MVAGKHSELRSSGRRQPVFKFSQAQSIGLADLWFDNNLRLYDATFGEVLPPLAAGQFRIWRRGATPVAFAAWAWLDRAAEARLLAGEPGLAPAEWQTGDHPWLMYLIAPYGGLGRFALDLRRTAFAGREVRVPQRVGSRFCVEIWPPCSPSGAFRRTGKQPVRPPGRFVDSLLHP